VLLCLVAGRTFSENELVQKRFELVIVAIVAISVLPAIVEFLRQRRRGPLASAASAAAMANEDAG
jgi:membrane-associated protein